MDVSCVSFLGRCNLVQVGMVVPVASRTVQWIACIASRILHGKLELSIVRVGAKPTLSIKLRIDKRELQLRGARFRDMLTFSMFINFGWEMFIETSRMLFGHKSVLAVGLSGCIQSLRWELRKKQRKVEKSKSRKVKKSEKSKKSKSYSKIRKVKKSKSPKCWKLQIFKFQDSSSKIKVCCVECSWILWIVLRMRISCI